MVWEKSQNCDCLPDEFKEECEAIKASLAAIDDLKFKIANIKATAFNGDEPKTPLTATNPKLPAPTAVQP